MIDFFGLANQSKNYYYMNDLIAMIKAYALTAKEKDRLGDHVYPPVDVYNKDFETQVWRDDVNFIFFRAAANYSADKAFTSTMTYDPETKKILITTYSFGVAYIISITAAARDWESCLCAQVEKAFCLVKNSPWYSDVLWGKRQDPLTSSIIIQLIKKFRATEFAALPNEIRGWFDKVPELSSVVPRYASSANRKEFDGWSIIMICFLLSQETITTLEHEVCRYTYEPGRTAEVSRGDQVLLDMSHWGRAFLNYLGVPPIARRP